MVYGLRAHHETGICYPSVRLIAQDSNCSIRTAQRHTATLCEEGWLLRFERFVKTRQTSNAYRLILPVPVDNSRGGVTSVTGGGVTSVTGGGVTSVTPRGDTSVTPRRVREFKEVGEDPVDNLALDALLAGMGRDYRIPS
jgi:hypothetical protein